MTRIINGEIGLTYSLREDHVSSPLEHSQTLDVGVQLDEGERERAEGNAEQAIHCLTETVEDRNQLL